jgi:hypothetical protein
MKQNKTIKIVCDKPEVAQALFNLITSSEQELCKQLKGVLAQHGFGTSDPKIEEPSFEKLSMVFTSKATNKGDVFYLNPVTGLVDICEYPHLEGDELYAIIESGKVVIFKRASSEDAFDKPYGTISNLYQLKEALVEIPLWEKKQKEEQEKQKLAQSTSTTVSEPVGPTMSVVRDSENVAETINE